MKSVANSTVLLLCFCCAFAFCFAVLLSPATLDQRLWSCGHLVLVLRPALAALPSPYSGAKQKSMEYKYGARTPDYGSLLRNYYQGGCWELDLISSPAPHIHNLLSRASCAQTA